MGLNRLKNLFANICYIHLINVIKHAVAGSYAQYLIPIMMVMAILASKSKIIIFNLRMHIQFRY